MPLLPFFSFRQLGGFITRAARTGFGLRPLYATLTARFRTTPIETYGPAYRAAEAQFVKGPAVAAFDKNTFMPRNLYTESILRQDKRYKYVIKLTGRDAVGNIISEGHISVGSDYPLTPGQAQYIGEAEQETWQSPPMVGIVTGEIEEAWHQTGATWL